MRARLSRAWRSHSSAAGPRRNSTPPSEFIRRRRKSSSRCAPSPRPDKICGAVWRAGVLKFQRSPGGAERCMPSPQEIQNELRKIRYPGFSRDIVSFGMVKDIEVAHGGVTVILTAASAKPEIVAEISSAVERTVAAMAGVGKIKIEVEQAP